jgi:hypothetical protein
MAGFGLPDIGGVKIPVKVPVKIPGLDRLMNRNEDPITTGIDDAVTEVALLDDYNPERGALIGLLPRGPKATIVLLPGLWEGTFRSYCLHAGTHRPGEGDGYLYAPLKGPAAGIIQHILQNSVSHPEIEQSKVQTLIWAILARTKISDCAPEIQQTASALMTKEEIDKCNGGALGKIPPEALNQVMGNLPPVAQQVMQAEDTIRGMLAGAANVPYDQLERVAVLDGDVAPPKGSREVPGGRWSYHPEGFFVRFSPSGYSQTRTQYYTPEEFKVEADGQGRISAIEDAQGVRVETKYDDGAGTLAFGGDAGTKGYALASIRLVGPDPDRPGQMKQAEVTNTGWVIVGAPKGKGRAAAAGARFPGAQDRYNWAVEHLVQLGTLNAVIGKVHPKRTAPKPSDLGNLMDLASYAQGLKLAVASEGAEAKWAMEQIGVVYRMWMTGAAMLGAEAKTTDAGTRLASAGETRLADVSPMTPIPRKRGGFDPSGGTASPGNTGKQRLAQSGAKSGSGNGNDTISKARKVTGAMSKGTSVAWRIGTGGGAPWGIPAAGAGQILDFNFDTWGKAADALAGDPPRDDYQLIATAEKGKLTPAKAGENVSQARADAVNAFGEAALGLTADLRAVTISLDRYGGALNAGEDAAATRQVRNAVRYEREGGFAMLIAADKLEALVKVCRDEGAQFPDITAEAVAAYQAELRAKGFSAEDVAAARSIGLTDEEIEACRQLRLRAAPEDMPGNILDVCVQLVEAMRELGRELILMPAVEVPGA